MQSDPPSPTVSADEVPTLDAATRRRLGYHLHRLFEPEPLTAIDGKIAELLLQLDQSHPAPDPGTAEK